MREDPKVTAIGYFSAEQPREVVGVGRTTRAAKGGERKDYGGRRRPETRVLARILLLLLLYLFTQMFFTFPGRQE